MTTAVESSASEHWSGEAEWGILGGLRVLPQGGVEAEHCTVLQPPLTANYERLEYWVYEWCGVSY
jgi:hypothetical protein